MLTERLTTLGAVKDWLGIKPEQTQSDAGLIRVINAASQFILGYLNRDGFSPRVYTENFRGNGKAQMLLRNWPVRSVTSVGVGSTSIPASTSFNVATPANGWLLSEPRQAPQSLELFGYHFYYRMPGQIVYEAGYANSETTTISKHEEGDPATDVIDPWTPTQAQWVANRSVTIDGTEATQITTGTPAAGEYLIDEWGVYTFSLADVGKVADVDYGYVPWDVAFAVTEIIGYWYRRKENIGVLSKTLGGQETVTFTQNDISDIAATSLQPYRNVVPV